MTNECFEKWFSFFPQLTTEDFTLYFEKNSGDDIEQFTKGFLIIRSNIAGGGVHYRAYGCLPDFNNAFRNNPEFGTRKNDSIKFEVMSQDYTKTPITITITIKENGHAYFNSKPHWQMTPPCEDSIYRTEIDLGKVISLKD